MHDYPQLVIKNTIAKCPAAVAIEVSNHIIEKEINRKKNNKWPECKKAYWFEKVHAADGYDAEYTAVFWQVQNSGNYCINKTQIGYAQALKRKKSIKNKKTLQ